MNVSPISNTNYNNRPSFGMALYMPAKEETITKMGKYVAEELEAARPTLEKLGRRVDLKVNPDPDKTGNLTTDRIEFLVTKISTPKVESNNSTNTKKNFITSVLDFFLNESNAKKEAVAKPNVISESDNSKYMQKNIYREFLNRDNIKTWISELVENFERAIEKY